METFKLEVLKTLYNQQQSTAHILRERISKITTGTVSSLVVIDGWIIASGEELLNPQVAMLILAVLVIVCIAVYSVHSRYKEFCAVAKLIVRIETAMKLYDPGIFIEQESLYPEEYKTLRDEEYEHGKNIFLSQAYILVAFGLLSIFLGIMAYLKNQYWLQGTGSLEQSAAIHKMLSSGTNQSRLVMKTFS